MGRSLITLGPHVIVCDVNKTGIRVPLLMQSDIFIENPLNARITGTIQCFLNIAVR